MKSPSGKVTWICPCCSSEDIEKEHIPLSWAALLHEDDIRYENSWYQTANYGHCIKCDSWFPWTGRTKISSKNMHSTTFTTVTDHPDKDWFYTKEDWEKSGPRWRNF